MKIIQTNKAYLPLIGGVETTIAGLAAGLSRAPGVEVEAHVCDGNRSLVMHRGHVHGVPVVYLPRWGTFASLPLSPAYVWHLAGLKGDILHVHEPFPLVDIAIRLFPRIRRNFARIVVTWHSDIVRQRWALGIYAPFIHNFLRQVDRIFVSSPALVDHSEYLAAYRDKCEVLPLGLDLSWTRRSTERAARVAEIRRSFAVPIVLFVGRLVYYKGLDHLVAAMSGVPDAHLVIIGQGPLQEAIDNQIRAAGLSGRITVLPHLDAEDLYAYYEACDVFVLPSTERSEAYGLVQIEAMACGKPVVCTEIHTGTTFVNQHGVTGLAVPPRDARCLADAIRQILENSDLRMQMGAAARQRALEHFTTDRMVTRTLETYRALLGATPATGREEC